MKFYSQTKIFIVEDNALYALMLDNVLRELGRFSIQSFGSAEACIAMIGNRPDVVVLDYSLGEGMNGHEALAHIREKSPGTAVIILSGQQDLDVAARLLKAGAFDYIEKKNPQQSIEKLRAAILRAVQCT